MSFKTFFIDLDETIYPTSCGVWDAISVRMEQYMHDRLGMDWEEIPSVRSALFQQYGTTLRGLQMTCSIDERDFIDYVHDVPLDQFLVPDKELCEMLQRYPQRKLILTNADRNHAQRVMQQLQVKDCFEGIIDIYDVAPHCKPMPEAFQTALRLAGQDNPQACVFIDDSLRNLHAARQLGFFTIRVGSSELVPQCHASIATLRDLPSVIPIPS